MHDLTLALSPQFELFYDGQCPICRREGNLARRLDRRGRVLFTNIAVEDFDPATTGRTMDQLMAEIHGRFPDGRVITGVEVFRQLYTAGGLGWLVWPTRLPEISHLLDVGYHWFAANRLRLTGRCDNGCRVPGASG